MNHILLNIKNIIKYLFFTLFIMSFHSCKNELSKKDLQKIDIDVKIDRFEQELFQMNPDTMSLAVSHFNKSFGDFFEIFTYHIIDIGTINERRFNESLNEFISNKQNREVYQEVMEVFPDLSEYEEDFLQAFKIFKHFFPEDNVPNLVSYVGGFNYPTFTVENYAGIGLDMYLGIDNDFYTRLGLSEYQKKNLYPGKLVSDVLYNWTNEKYPFNDSVENLLSHIIHEGKILYFIDKLLSETKLETKFGFTEEELQWLKNNEEQMWIYLIEHKLLYSSDIMDIRKLVGPAPYTSFFTEESPGRAVIWTGYKILKNYAKKNPELNLKDIMLQTDYQEILRASRYNP